MYVCDFSNGEEKSLYRMREDSDEKLDKKEQLFHIKNSLRKLVKESRYSQKGFPNLYLASTPLCCWFELGKPNFENLYISRFEYTDTSKKILNIGQVPSEVKICLGIRNPRNQNQYYTLNDADNYFVTYPLMMSCSILKQHNNENFIPEYIVPNLLMQWIRSEANNVIGIKYLSTRSQKKYFNYSNVFFSNYVFPCFQLDGGEKYCPKLKSKFKISEPVRLNTFDILNHYNIEDYGDSELDFCFHSKYYTRVPHDLNYFNTEFFMIEKKLISNEVNYI